MLQVFKLFVSAVEEKELVKMNIIPYHLMVVTSQEEVVDWGGKIISLLLQVKHIL